MVVAGKMLWVLLQPDNLLALWLVLSVLLLWTRWRRLGRISATLAVIVLVICAVFPVGRWAAQPLETRFAAPQLPDSVDGIVLLGGNMRTGLAKQPDDLSNLSQHVIAFVELARRYPNARLVFTGGSTPLIANALSEADEIRPVLAALGIDLARVLFEATARNTMENAERSKTLAQPKPGERWLLIASAVHMPRAVGVFRGQGWPVIAYPVDLPPEQPRPVFSVALAPNLINLTRAAHEWLGLIIYRVLGHTRELLPA